MSLIKEFKEFAMKGNVVDLAVGVIVGVAFGKVVTSVVNDIIMPPIGKLMGGVNFSDLFINLDPSKLAQNGVVIKSLAQAKEAGASPGWPAARTNKRRKVARRNPRHSESALLNGRIKTRAAGLKKSSPSRAR